MTQPTQPGLNPYGTMGDPSVNNAGGTQPTSTQPPAATPPVTTAPTTNAPNQGSGLTGNPTYDGLIADATKQIDQASQQVANLADQVRTASRTLASLDASDPGYAAATRNYDALNASYVTAMNNLARAYDNRIATATKALDARWMQPGQQTVWQAQAAKDQADADKALADTAVLKETSGPQRDLLVAQSAQTTAQARLNEANAGNITAKTPAEIAQLQSSADLASANAAQVRTQTQLTAAQLPTAGRAAEASTETLEQQALDAIRKNRQAPTDSQAVTTNEAAVTKAVADAQQAVQAVQKGVLGPLYGLPQQVSAIKDAINSIADRAHAGQLPSDPDYLNNLLNQYITATAGGTTVAGAATQTEQAQEAGQRSLEQQRQQNVGLLQTGLSAMGGMVNAGVSGLLPLVKDLPKGSTALGPAVQDIYNMASNAVQQPQFQASPTIQPPALPPFLQNFAAQKSDPAAVAAAAVHAAVSAAQSPSTPAAASPAPPPAPAPAMPAATPPAAFAQSDQGEGSARGLPNMLQPHAPADANFVNQLWGRAA